MKTFILSLLLCFCLFKAEDASAQTVKYRVRAIKNGNETISSLSNASEVQPPLALQVPSAFSPNGDGLNDDFGVVCAGISEFKMSIYNRWGEMLFETKALGGKWDGTYRNQLSPDDTYVYDIMAKSHQGERVFKTGTFNLVIKD